NEARHVLAMTEDLSDVLALELYTAAQALDYRQEMLNAARRLAARGDWRSLAGKIGNAPREDSRDYTRFGEEVRMLMTQLVAAPDFRSGEAVRATHARIRETIPFMHRDRAMDGDVTQACRLVRERRLV
ncbi:MAG TPA: aromatic amino acid lyase, partial [Rhodanobacteraceae bacterium]